MMKQILLVAVIWLLTFASSVLAIVAVLLARPGHPRWAALLAITAILAGGMGFTAWTPFGFFPEIGYTWSSDRVEISIRSGWFFIVPLVLGGFALLLAMWKRRKHFEGA